MLIPLGFFGGFGGSDKWIATIGNGVDHIETKNVAYGASGAAYVVGSTTYNNGYLAKFAKDGAIAWQRNLYDASFADELWGVDTDASENVYVGGWSNAYKRAIVAKYNSAGVIQWQRSWELTAYSYGAQRLVVDASGNVYAGGTALRTGNGRFLTVHLNTSGAFVKSISHSQPDYALSGEPSGLAINSSNEIFIANVAGYNSNHVWLYKYNSSGGKTNFNEIYSAANTMDRASIAVGPDGNVLLTSRDNNGIWWLIKLATSGANFSVVWKRMIRHTSNVATISGETRAVAVDSSNNVYVVGSYYSGKTYPVIMKFDSSGTVQWSRVITSPFANSGAFSIDLNADGSRLAVALHWDASGAVMDRGFVITYPTDGSFTGDLVVNGSTFNISGASMNVYTDFVLNLATNDIFTSGNPTITVSAASQTESAATLANAVKNY